MAEDKVKFTVEGKGKNLKKTAKEAKSVGDGADHAARGLDKADKAGNKYHKTQKGVAGASSNSTKNFSKMQQGLSGSSGLVGAYATLAANVFAASAAFNALRNAAQFETMITGLQEVGAAAGRNLTFAADRLREISGEALSAETSVRVMALGISSGFRTDQMERLTVVAKGAALALGRDMTDALDRLTRGTAKLEPEILDELGIMVRLDDATLEYATTLGKSVNDLTQYERRQAFLNATLEQGEKKFGLLAESVPVNPYDQLGASLNNLAKDFLGFFNEVLDPVLKLFIENQRALIAGLALFASTIVGTMMPGLLGMVRGMAMSARVTAAETKEKLLNLKTTGKLPKAYIQATKEIQKTGFTQEKYKQGLNSLNASLRQHQVQQAKMKKGTAEEIALYKAKTLAIGEVVMAKRALIVAYQAEGISQARNVAAQGIELLAAGSLGEGFKKLGSGIGDFWKRTVKVGPGIGMLGKAFNVLRGIIGSVGLALRGALSLLMGPWGLVIGLIAGAVFTFWDTIKGFLGFAESEVPRASDKIVKSLDSIDKSAEHFNDTIKREGGLNASAMVAGYKVLSGILASTIGSMKSLEEQSKATNAAAIEGLENTLKFHEGQVARLKSRIARLIAEPRTRVNQAALQTAQNELATQQTLVQKSTDMLADRLEETNRKLGGDIARVIQETMNKISKDPVFGKFAATQVEGMGAAIEKFSKAGSSPEEQAAARKVLHDDFIRLSAPVNNITDGFAGATDALSQWNQAVNALTTKKETPFDTAIDAAGALAARINQVKSGIGKDGLKLGKKEQDQLVEAIREQTGAADLLGLGDMDAYVNGLKEARKELIASAGRVKVLQASHKKLQSIQKLQGSEAASLMIQRKQEAIRKQKLKGIQAELVLLREIAGEEIKRLETKVKNEDDITKKEILQTQLRRKSMEFEIRIADKVQEELATKEAEVSIEEQRAQAKLDGLQVEGRILDIMKSQMQAQIRLKEIVLERQKIAIELQNASSKGRVSRGGGAELTPQQEYNLAVKQRDAKKEIIDSNTRMIIMDLEFTAKRVKMETNLLLIKLKEKQDNHKVWEEEWQLAQQTTKLAHELLSKNEAIVTLRTAAAWAENALAKENLKVDEARLRIASDRATVSASATGATTAQRVGNMGQALQDRIGVAHTPKTIKAARDKALKEITSAWHESREQGKSWKPESLEDFIGQDIDTYLDAQQDSFINMTQGIKEAFQGLDFSDKFRMVANSLQPLIDGFRELGPEGVAVADGMTNAMGGLDGFSQSFSGVSNMLEDGSFSKMGEGGLKQLFDGTTGGTFEEKAQAVAGGIGAAAGMASALFATQKMASEVAIARIDQEIAAEKKRDGQSAASIAKIKKLEADKEKHKKKAFEQDKKMKIAQTVMATSLAVMQAFGQMGPIAGAIMSAFIIALGAKQIAIISSMQYQGGGTGASGGGTPPKVTMGSRSNKVDVAGGAAGGELSYLRGGRGIGSNASDFSRRGAFAGAKYRAVGGAAYVVGEQGPEVIVPDVPGRIIPNDELGEGSAPINATFNINTIDAANMEETLVSQRGNIINMIREAANNQGETFLEGLDTMALGDS